MASSENHCRRVSCIQLEALCEILNRHRDVAMGYNKSTRARNQSQKVWEMAAQTLNSLGDDGATKNWRGWSAYWVDYKAKLKKKLSGIRGSHAQTEGSTLDAGELDNIQIKFLEVLGHNFGLGLTQPQVDPSCQVMTSDDPVANATDDGALSPLQTEETVEIKEEPTLPSPDLTETSGSMEVREGGEPVAASLACTRAAGPRRRRRARAFYSQQKARYLLVHSSLARMRYARQNVNSLKGMLDALLRIARSLEEIKSLCFSRETNVRV